MAKETKHSARAAHAGDDASAPAGVEEGTAEAPPTSPSIPDSEQTGEPVPDAPSEGEAPAALEHQLEAERLRSKEHWDAVLRSRAELDNLRKRAARDLEQAHKFGLDRFVAELLPVKDSMELGLEASAEEDVDPVKIRKGVELTLKMFNQVVEKFGVVEVDPLGEQFDPEYHQAMTMRDVGDAEPGSVLNVVQKGYLLNGRLVRPAMVIVAK